MAEPLRAPQPAALSRAPVAETRPRSSAPSARRVRLPRYPNLPECTDDGGPSAPCQHADCRYHLANRGYWEHHLEPTRDCAIDVANEGPHTLDEVAAVLGTSGERVRQIEEQALEVLKHSVTLKGLHHG